MTLLEELETKAMSLSVHDRGILVHDLIRTLDQDITLSESYQTEISRRVEAVKNGTAKMIPSSELFADL